MGYRSWTDIFASSQAMKLGRQICGRMRSLLIWLPFKYTTVHREYFSNTMRLHVMKVEQHSILIWVSCSCLKAQRSAVHCYFISTLAFNLLPRNGIIMKLKKNSGPPIYPFQGPRGLHDMSTQVINFHKIFKIKYFNAIG